MTTYFISRHPGAIEWAKKNGFEDAQMVSHFDPSDVQPGDKIIGTLPVHLAAQVCENGGEFFHLNLNLPPEARGKELTVEDMEAFGAHLQRYQVRKI